LRLVEASTLAGSSSAWGWGLAATGRALHADARKHPANGLRTDAVIRTTRAFVADASLRGHDKPGLRRGTNHLRDPPPGITPLVLFCFGTNTVSNLLIFWQLIP
jgi:hypothetical protein